jgi:hypothetical protein
MLDGVVVDDTKLFNTKLQEWEHFYNFERPHGALGGQTPTSDYARRRRPRCKRPPSVAHLEGTVEHQGLDLRYV